MQRQVATPLGVRLNTLCTSLAPSAIVHPNCGGYSFVEALSKMLPLLGLFTYRSRRFLTYSRISARTSSV